MRLAFVASLALTCACATLPPFRAVDPAQAVPREPDAASVDAGGVRITVRPGSWSGTSRDLEDVLTPVEIAIENRSGRALQVRPDAFGLVAPNGFRYAALEPRAVRRLLAPYTGGPGWYYGFYGVYPWPGFYQPWGAFYPYSWWGPWGPYGPYYGPPYPPAPPPRALATKGTLEDGGHVSLLLLFPVPATSLSSIVFEANLLDPSGAPVSAARAPFAREGRPLPPPPRQPSGPPAPPEQPPSPASATPPPGQP